MGPISKTGTVQCTNSTPFIGVSLMASVF